MISKDDLFLSYSVEPLPTKFIHSILPSLSHLEREIIFSLPLLRYEDLFSIESSQEVLRDAVSGFGRQVSANRGDSC